MFPTNSKDFLGLEHSNRSIPVLENGQLVWASVDDNITNELIQKTVSALLAESSFASPFEKALVLHTLAIRFSLYCSKNPDAKQVVSELSQEVFKLYNDELCSKELEPHLKDLEATTITDEQPNGIKFALHLHMNSSFDISDVCFNDSTKGKPIFSKEFCQNASRIVTEFAQFKLAEKETVNNFFSVADQVPATLKDLLINYYARETAALKVSFPDVAPEGLIDNMLTSALLTHRTKKAFLALPHPDSSIPLLNQKGQLIWSSIDDTLTDEQIQNVSFVLSALPEEPTIDKVLLLHSFIVRLCLFRPNYPNAKMMIANMQEEIGKLLTTMQKSVDEKLFCKVSLGEALNTPGLGFVDKMLADRFIRQGGVGPCPKKFADAIKEQVSTLPKNVEAKQPQQKTETPSLILESLGMFENKSTNGPRRVRLEERLAIFSILSGKTEFISAEIKTVNGIFSKLHTTTQVAAKELLISYYQAVAKTLGSSVEELIPEALQEKKVDATE